MSDKPLEADPTAVNPSRTLTREEWLESVIVVLRQRADEAEAKLAEYTKPIVGHISYLHDSEVSKLRREVEGLRAQRDFLLADIAAAAGEFGVTSPEPGSDVSKLLAANVIMRRQRDSARKTVRAQGPKNLMKLIRLLRKELDESDDIIRIYAAGFTVQIKANEEALEATKEYV